LGLKLKSPGQRCLTIVDGKTRFRYVKGGCSSKIYDGRFMKLMEDDIPNKSNGGVVLADSPFENEKKRLEKILGFIQILLQEVWKKLVIILCLTYYVITDHITSNIRTQEHELKPPKLF
jgi:23S rRNA A2030 N6-methylase RlmJ